MAKRSPTDTAVKPATSSSATLVGHATSAPATPPDNWLTQIVRVNDASAMDAMRPIFEDLQGNILRGHGRDQTVHIFFRILPGKTAAAKSWLKQFGRTRVTTFAKQLEQNRLFSRYELPSEIFCGLSLTAAGYQALGVAASKRPTDPSFSAGMKASLSKLADPPLNEWQEGFRSEVHGVVLMADDDGDFLRRDARQVFDRIINFADVLAVEHGRGLRNKDGNAIEHFGYVDGRSQPLFLDKDIDAERARGATNWDPSATPSLVLVADPGGTAKRSFGSYFVFRKLEQNVAGFKAAEDQLATALGLTGDARERAGALVVGRFEDGTPVTLHQTDGHSRPQVENDFAYPNGDAQGLKCPFAGHIRKTNPRGDSVALGATLEQERGHRIARRGITYGQRPDHPNDDVPPERRPTKDVGLLFMCYQADIANQFEFMQQSWANHPSFARPQTGIDPLIGQGNGAGQKWNSNWGQLSSNTPFDFRGFVAMKGGEYFFTPSIKMLVSL